MEFNWSCFQEHGQEDWSLNNLLKVTSMKKGTPLLPTTTSCQSSPREWWDLIHPSLSGVTQKDSTVLNRSYAGCHSCSKSVNTMLSRSEVVHYPRASPSSSSSVFSDSSSTMPLSLGGSDINYLWPSIPRSLLLSLSVTCEFYINCYLLRHTLVTKASSSSNLCAQMRVFRGQFDHMPIY